MEKSASHPIFTDQLHPEKPMVTVGGRVEAPEINPNRVVRFKTAEQLGIEDSPSDEALETRMRKALEAFAELRQEYGIDSVYLSHRLAQTDPTPSDNGRGILIVSRRVDGVSIYDAQLSRDEYQRILDRCMDYSQASLNSEGYMFCDLRPENIFWGHTADNTHDRLINIDPDPDVEEGPIKAAAIRTNLDMYWEPFAQHFDLDDASIRQTWKDSERVLADAF